MHGRRRLLIEISSFFLKKKAKQNLPITRGRTERDGCIDRSIGEKKRKRGKKEAFNFDRIEEMDINILGSLVCFRRFSFFIGIR